MWYDVHTMGKPSLLTPVYFFSSMRAGSGKSTMLANLAIFLNNSGHKIAIVDLDSATPQKIKASFPRAINLQEYSDISLISQKGDSRYQKTFYFTETSLISYFPAHRMTDISVLFSDTTLRDFFIQITSCFDTVMVNLPAGPLHSHKVSQLLARTHLWRGKAPVSIIVSQSDEKSLLNLDSLIHENPAFYYQLQENALLLFNRVPNSVEDQKLAENTLNSQELRNLFNFPTTFVVGISEEFPHQRQITAPQVLNQNSLTHQTIAAFNRLLSGTTRSLSRALYEHASDYQACLDGQLLEKLSPYLDKIQTQSAQRLFQHPSNIQVFLEENEGNYRIRIRLTGVRQPVASITRTIEHRFQRNLKDLLPPAIWSFTKDITRPERLEAASKKERALPTVKPIYRFDDHFAGAVDLRLRCDFDFLPDRNRYPSPILFRPILEMPDIPSLSEVLGFRRKQFKKCFYAPEKQESKAGVTHFFIPPEFDLISQFNCAFTAAYSVSMLMTIRQELPHTVPPFVTPCMYERQLVLREDMPDLFARTMTVKPCELPPPDFNSEFIHRFMSKQLYHTRISHSPALLPAGNYLSKQQAMPAITQKDIPPVIYISVSALIKLADNREKEARPSGHQWRDNFELTGKRPDKYSLTDNDNLVLSLLQANNQPTSEDLFRFSFDNTTTTYKTSIFSKCERETPRSFSHDRASPEKEIYLPFKELQLPESFKLADVLVDHYFPATVYKLDHKNSFDTERRVRLCNFTHPLFFIQTFTEINSSDLPKTLVSERQELVYRFIAAGSNYHDLPHRLNPDKNLFRDQILKPSHDFEKIRIYRDIANIDATRTDVVLDQQSRRQKFLPSRERITEIKVTLARPPVLSHTIHNRDITPRISSRIAKPVFRQLSMLKQPEKFTAEIAPQLLQIISRYDQTDKMPNICKYLSDTMYMKEANPAFTIDVPELYTLSVRIGSRRIQHQVDTSIDNRIDIDTMIENVRFDFQNLYQPPLLKPVFKNTFPIFAACPLRARKIELPQNLAFADSQTTSEALDHDSPIIFSADNKFSAEFSSHIKKLSSDYDKLVMLRQSLPKPAARLWNRLEPKRKQLRAIFPDSLETLYNHLLWSIAVRRQQPGIFSDRAMRLTEPANESFVSRKDLVIGQTKFTDKNLINARRISQNFSRNAIKVSKLRLKDLMSLARQASEKFNQLNSRLRA